MDTKELGYFAENIATRHLASKGYEIIEQNYRKPWGEIDIIAKLDGAIIFVEVKANRQEFIGEFEPEARVDSKKIAKITKTAALYLEYELKEPDIGWQVDIVSITFDKLNQKAKIKHFKNIAESIF